MGLYLYTRFPIVLIVGLISLMLGLGHRCWFSTKEVIVGLIVCLLLLIRLIQTSDAYATINQMAEALDGQTIEIQGVLFQADPFKTDSYVCVVHKIQSERVKDIKWDSSWRPANNQIKIEGTSIPSESLYKPVTLSVKFRSIAPPGNPGVFNYQLYAYVHHMIGTAKILNKNGQIELKRNAQGEMPMTMWDKIQINWVKYRIAVVQKLSARLIATNSTQSHALSVAMLFGYDTLMDEESLEDYYISGTIHLLTVSGFHFALMYALLSKTIRFFPLSYRTRFILSFTFVLAFVWLTGTKFAPIRAALSMELFLMAPLINRRFDLLTSVSIPIIGELLMNPFCLSDLSVSLTFLACIGIGYIYPLVKHSVFVKKVMRHCPIFVQGILNAWLISTACAFSTFLIVFQGANRMNFVSWISNLILAVLSSLFMTLQLVLLVLNLNSAFYGTLVMQLTDLFSKAFELFNGLHRIMPYNPVVYAPDYSLWAVCVLGILTMTLIVRGHCQLKKWTYQFWLKCALSVMVGFVMVFYSMDAIHPQSKCQIIFWDVGQGDSTLIKYKGHGVVIDAGPPNFNLQNQLFEARIKTFEALLLTHGHLDHIGGIGTLIAFPHPNSQNQTTSQLMKMKIDNKTVTLKISAHRYRAIPELKIWGIENVSQPSNAHGISDSDENQNMTVYWIQYGSFDALVLGDATGEMEKYVTYYLLNQKIDLDVLRTSHHGSASSSTDFMLQKLMPQMIVVSVGENYYGHPTEAALERMYAVTPYVYTTQELGQIKLVLESNRVWLSIWGKTSFNWRERVL